MSRIWNKMHSVITGYYYRVIPIAMKIRDCLRRKWRSGFWFPCFKKKIAWTHERLSLARDINVWLHENDNPLLGAMEFYQFAIALVAALWLVLIERPLHPWLTEWLVRFIFTLVAGYFIVEFFVFLLHWVFVAEGRLEDARRSLATFLFNFLLEMPLLFAIVFRLNGCITPLTNRNAIFVYVETILQPKIVHVQDTLGCQLMADFQFIIAVTLLLIVIASLVNLIGRPQK